METKIENLLASNKFDEAISVCQSANYNGILRLICDSYVSTNVPSTNVPSTNVSTSVPSMDTEVSTNVSTKVPTKLHIKREFTIKLLCNWMSSKDLAMLWNKMTQGNFRWNNMTVVWDKTPDYYVVINATSEYIEPKKTIVFQMEPNMPHHPQIWGPWTNPKNDEFLKVFRHSTDYNNNEWHLSCSYYHLMSIKIEKKYNTVSTIMSSKYTDVGQVKRIDFIKFLESKNFNIDVFGDNKWMYKNYKGDLPYHAKDDGLMPYKYTFNVENHFIPNYYTEKIIDGILSECLVFYSGCINIREYINPNAFVYLELSNFENDYQIVKNAIETDLWSKRIDIIRAEKMKILNEKQFFPRVYNWITNNACPSM